MNLRFDSSGWLAVVAEEFTFANLRLVAQAICNYTRKLQSYTDNFPPQLVVGYDSRFMGKHFADIVAEVISGNGLNVFLSDRPAPTPVVSWMIRDMVATGALVITGGNESAEYNGVKFVTSHTTTAGEHATDQIEDELKNLVLTNSLPGFSLSPGDIATVNPEPAYFQQLHGLVDLEKILAASIDTTVDYLYGAASGYLGQLFSACNGVIREVRHNPAADFNRLVPALTPQNLYSLQQIVVVPHSQLALGLAIDGDGCRMQAVDASGAIIPHDHLLALLIDYFVTQKEWDGGVVTTSRFDHPLSEQVAAFHQIPFYSLDTTDFRHLAVELLRKGAIVASDGQGGYAFAGHIMERDGVLASMFVLEMLASCRQNLSLLLSELKKKIHR